MGAARRVRVLIADDEPLVRYLLRQVLEGEGVDVVAEAGDGKGAVQAAVSHHPDVIVMDISMPIVDGIEATRRIRDAMGTDGPRVLVLTNYDGDEYVFGALRAGASGFLLKDEARDNLPGAVKVIAQGDSLLAPSVTRRVVETFARADHPTPVATVPPDRLTRREKEVLRYVAAGLSNGEIAERLRISEATVRTHVYHVLSKLQLPDRVHAVIYAYERGLAGVGGTHQPNGPSKVAGG